MVLSYQNSFEVLNAKKDPFTLIFFEVQPGRSAILARANFFLYPSSPIPRIYDVLIAENNKIISKSGHKSIYNKFFSCYMAICYGRINCTFWSWKQIAAFFTFSPSHWARFEICPISHLHQSLSK